MDGQNQRRLVYRDIQGPIGLAIDYPTQRLYWADIKTNKIETVKLDGTDRHLVKHFASGKKSHRFIMLYFVSYEIKKHKIV